MSFSDTRPKRKRQVQHHVMLDFAALVATFTALVDYGDEMLRVGILRGSVDQNFYAVCDAQKAVGQALATRFEFRDLQRFADAIAKRNPARWGPRYSRIEAALDGARTFDGDIWLK
jgi:hypothetical protein